FVPDDAARRGDLPGRPHINVNPDAALYLNLFPRPNSSTTSGGIGQYRFTQTQPTTVDYVTGRGDWIPSTKDSFFARYTIDNSSKLRMEAPDHAMGLFAESELHWNQYVILGWTRSLSTSTFNTARMGFNRSVTLVDLKNLANVSDSLSF